MSLPTRRYSTGLPFLDSRLDGGIPAGTLLALVAPASSQGELLLYHFATSQSTLYVSTTNPAEVELRAAIEETAIPNPAALEFLYVPPQELITEPESFLDRIRPETFVVINPVDYLERGDDGQYLSTINSMKRTLRETDSVGILYCLDTDPPPDDRRFTLERADSVWRLEQTVLSREINTRLLITKARRGTVLSEPIPLVMGDHVRVDTSRRIA